jgi:hypothetical protein
MSGLVSHNLTVSKPMGYKTSHAPPLSLSGLPESRGAAILITMSHNLLLEW